MDTLLFRAYNKDTLKTWFYFGDSRCFFFLLFPAKAFAGPRARWGCEPQVFFAIIMYYRESVSLGCKKHS